jgi:hypothetical protein
VAFRAKSSWALAFDGARQPSRPDPERKKEAETSKEKKERTSHGYLEMGRVNFVFEFEDGT